MKTKLNVSSLCFKCNNISIFLFLNKKNVIDIFDLILKNLSPNNLLSKISSKPEQRNINYNFLFRRYLLF